ncbi:hypothetical protein P9112_001610 [Eukaryota sp. TZLM1-RC]
MVLLHLFCPRLQTLRTVSVVASILCFVLVFVLLYNASEHVDNTGTPIPNFLYSGEQHFIPDSPPTQRSTESTPYNSLPVHLVCTNDNCSFNFLNWIQIRSVQSFINHSQIYLHVFGDPIENYWYKKVSDSLSLVYHNKTYYENLVPNIKVTSLAHLSDFIRIYVMCEQGGIYLDMDEFPIKPWNPLLTQLVEPIDAILARHATDHIQVAAMIAYPKTKIWCEIMCENKRLCTISLGLGIVPDCLPIFTTRIPNTNSLR